MATIDSGHAKFSDLDFGVHYDLGEGLRPDDAHIREQLANQARRALELARLQREGTHPLTDEQLENERWQFESNALAESNPFYSAARSASVNFLVVPLEPGGTTPLIDPSEASNDPRKILTWWAEYGDANVGVALGRKGGLVALKVEDADAYERLRDIAGVPMRDENDRRWIEYRDLGSYQVRLVNVEPPFSMRSVMGWGRELDRKAAEFARQSKNPETFWLVHSYHSIVSGYDAWEFRSRSVVPGVRVMGDGEVLAWDGSILDGVRVVAPMSRPPEIPLWLANTIGKPRSRKVMAAARAAHDAALREQESYWRGVVEAAQGAGKLALKVALADKQRAIKELQEAEAEQEEAE